MRDAASEEKPRCELLYCGATDFASVGRGKTNESGAHADLVEPHRFEALADKTWTHVAGGAAATHCAAIDGDGTAVHVGTERAGTARTRGLREPRDADASGGAGGDAVRERGVREGTHGGGVRKRGRVRIWIE